MVALTANVFGKLLSWELLPYIDYSALVGDYTDFLCMCTYIYYVCILLFICRV